MTNELETLKAAWRQCAPPAAPPLQVAQLRTLVAARYRREQRVVGRYVVGSVCWQAIVYAALGYMALRYRADGATLGACALGGLLYVPFTVVFGQKLWGYARRQQQASAGPALATHVAQQYELLSQFFRFKKRFDLLATPLTALVMVAFFVRLGWAPAFTASPGPGVCLFGLIVSVFGLALRWENRHQFAAPLRRLQILRHDLAREAPAP